MRNDSRESMPLLAQLWGGYFNQDWDCEAPTPDDVVREFIKDVGSRAHEARAELQGLLSRATDERELERIIIQELGGYYLATADGWTWRAWLEHVSAMLSAHE